MANFGPVTYGRSKFSEKGIIIHSLSTAANSVYHFAKKESAKKWESWDCFACRRTNQSSNPKRPVPVVRVQNDIFLDDPENPRSAHFCTPLSLAESGARQIMRDSVRQIRAGKRPLKAHED